MGVVSPNLAPLAWVYNSSESARLAPVVQRLERGSYKAVTWVRLPPGVLSLTLSAIIGDHGEVSGKEE